MPRRATLIAFILATAACAAVVGLDGYAVDDVCQGTACDGGSAAEDGAATPSDAGVKDTGATPTDAKADADAGAARPSYCTGISFYVSFDKDLVSAEGDAPVRQSDGTSRVAGRLGQGLSLSGASTIYYAVGDAGPPRWTEQTGSIALWAKPNWSFVGSSTHTFARQAGAFNTASTAGPRLIHTNATEPPRVGLTADAFAVYLSQAASLWKDKDWNHLIGTWKGQRFTVTINGAPTDSNLGHNEDAGAWTRIEDPVYFRLGSEASGVDSILDDVAFWTRDLSLAESRAIHTDALAGRSIGDACGL